MPQRVTTVSTVVIRDGKRVVLEPGTPYDFTAQEAKDFESLHPGSLRKPVIEATPAVPGVTLDAVNTQTELKDEVESVKTETKPLTKAQKAAQDKAAAAAKLKDEQEAGSTSGEEDL